MNFLKKAVTKVTNTGIKIGLNQAEKGVVRKGVSKDVAAKGKTAVKHLADTNKGLQSQLNKVNNIGTATAVVGIVGGAVVAAPVIAGGGAAAGGGTGAAAGVAGAGGLGGALSVGVGAISAVGGVVSSFKKESPSVGIEPDPSISGVVGSQVPGFQQNPVTEDLFSSAPGGSMTMICAGVLLLFVFLLKKK